MSLLVICKILGLFANTLTADNKDSLRSCENLVQPTQMQLSKREKFFSQFSATFLEPTLNFDHFGKKDDAHSLCIFEVTHFERRG